MTVAGIGVAKVVTPSAGDSNERSSASFSEERLREFVRKETGNGESSQPKVSPPSLRQLEPHDLSFQYFSGLEINGKWVVGRIIPGFSLPCESTELAVL